MHPVRVKSSAELEEEMMTKIPKFKARPLNKKIFEASTPLPSLPRSTPMPPEFQSKKCIAFEEFHFETMARASKNAETSSVASTEAPCQNIERKPQLTEPKSPVLQTSLREKSPKIFESKEELGIFCNAKKQVTIPQEFHFATHERIPPPPLAVFDLLDKLSLNSESSHDPIPRNTIPNPFHLHTEERSVEKEKKFAMEILEKQFEEEQARVPKATPYSYTTDYPVIKEKETIYMRYREESEAARMVFQGNNKTDITASTSSPKNRKEENGQFDQHTNFKSGQPYEMILVSGNRVVQAPPPPTGGGCSRTFEPLVKQLKDQTINHH
ncbi:Protein TPX2 [Hibiscus syriacus]|uniref:Protein TPX2 n=1 Tax=Hibiscus syriacus TaxID=106335 RepID=A0A6A3APU6_HIBSY|nr:Protein TPX2 [Hibiscus syriacus]